MPRPVIFPKPEECPISQLRPAKRSDERENPSKARNERGISASRVRPYALIEGVHVLLAKKRRHHISGQLHHPYHPLTQQCRVGVIQVSYAKATMCDGSTHHRPSNQGTPPRGLCPTLEKPPHGSLKSAFERLT